MKTIRYISILFGFAGILNTSKAQDYSAPPPAPSPPNQSYTGGDISIPSGYFEIGFGLAQPTGKFMSNSSSGYGGYALPGSNFELSLGVPVNHSNLGVAFMFGSCDNSFDINTYVSNVSMSDQSKSYTPLIQDDYNENFIMAGLFATIPLYRLSIDFRLMGGIAFCYLPEVDYGASEYDPLVAGYDNYEWDTYSSRSTSFAYGFGADLRYRIRRFSVMFGVNYIATNPVVSTEQQYTDPNGDYTYTHVGGSIPISIVSANIGLAYQIR
jgi:hypothetical protein